MKNLLLLTMGLTLVTGAFAKTVSYPTPNFLPELDKLKVHDVHFSLQVMEGKEFMARHSHLSDLDTLKLSSDPKVKLVLVKTVAVVKKPVGFFDHELMNSASFLTHIHRPSSVKKLQDESYEVSLKSHSFRVKSYFDSDEVSTLSASRRIHAVMATKKNDVVAQSASSVVVNELYQFSNKFRAGVEIHSFIPYREDATVVISYRLLGLTAEGIAEKDLSKDILQTIERQLISMSTFENK